MTNQPYFVIPENMEVKIEHDGIMVSWGDTSYADPNSSC